MCITDLNLTTAWWLSLNLWIVTVVVAVMLIVVVVVVLVVVVVVVVWDDVIYFGLIILNLCVI